MACKGKELVKWLVIFIMATQGKCSAYAAETGRTGQIAAVGMVGYYGFTTIGIVNIKDVENDIFGEKRDKNSC